MKAMTLLPLCFTSSCLSVLLLALSLCTICVGDQSSDPILCIPTERLALIDLKNNLTDETNRLSSWVGKHCCSWSGVVCDNVTGHVHEIHLRGLDLNIFNGPYDTYDEDEEASKQMLGGTISPSVIKLLQLRYLDLSLNDFGYSLIPAFIGSFQNLIYLNLSYSHFGGEIPHRLGNISTLRVLDLQHSIHSGHLHSKSLTWLNNLKGLEHMNLGGINLANASDWFPVVSNITSLLELRFSACGLDQSPSNPTTVRFTSLIVLDLSRNYFDSMLPAWIFSLHNLVLLDLTGCYFSGVLPGTPGGFYSLPSLRTLCVSDNSFVNSPSFQLSSLSNLRRLEVRGCKLSSPILQNLSLIEHVDLSYNEIVEEIPKSLSNLCNITTLYLGGNNFFGNVSELLERFCECESLKLEALDFSGNYLIGQLPQRIGKLKNLIKIDLGNNNLTGTIPDSLGSLSMLQILDINTNKLSGSLPDTIGGLSSTIGGLSWLEYLDLSYNKLRGSLPECIGGLSKLYHLSLLHNSLTGILTENHFANLTALKYLRVGENKLAFKLSVNNWIPPFKLKELRADSCSLGPQFPSWIQSQKDLTRINIANANISDTIPDWFWTSFPSVVNLNISNNIIQGKLGDVISFAPLAVLDLSNNVLHGTLPGNFSTMHFLDLSNNNLSGSLEQFLCFGIQEPQPLQFLLLANNNMSGVISDCWMNYKSLIILNLEKNQFSGIIPPSLGNISLLLLDLDDNRLSGNLPLWLLNSTSLVAIKLARNELMRKIPPSIGGNNTSMRVLSLRSNHFEGKIPEEICHLRSLQILDLSHNDLSGNLPICFTNFSVMSGRSEASNLIELYYTMFAVPLVTKGYTYTYSTILYQVTSLDLSSNRFSGSIPDELVELLGLRFLNLSDNELTGTIPNSFSHTGKLEALDLSMNHLNGNIPLSMSQLTALNWLNLSYNKLVGGIPTGPQFQTFGELSFTGNALCGYPLPACFQNNGDTKGSANDKAYGRDWILVILTLVGFVVGFWSIMASLFLSRQWRIAYYRFLEEIWFKLQDFIFLLFLRLTKRSRPI
ncbi:receptor-like protein EIX2 [Bidens hawaiensis]|uniref:receptor-like protein EIX2 n=1 Tax=Bidens hawaiensis TaxID=980011 RepID=UPI00404ACB2D